MGTVNICRRRTVFKVLSLITWLSDKALSFTGCQILMHWVGSASWQPIQSHMYRWRKWPGQSLLPSLQQTLLPIKKKKKKTCSFWAWVYIYKNRAMFMWCSFNCNVPRCIARTESPSQHNQMVSIKAQTLSDQAAFRFTSGACGSGKTHWAWC